jgi:tetratricopeptide (TPR) repeat protein
MTPGDHCTPMPYDRLGFPIPRDFEPPPRPGGDSAPSSRRVGPWDAEDAPRRRVGAGKRFFVWALLLFGVVPAILLPAALPLVREAMVQWSVERAMAHEARDDVASAAADVGRAIVWIDADAQAQARLLCWRSTLLLENRQTAAAVAEASRAVALVPTAALPRRTRALAHVVAGDAEAALVDAQAAVELTGADNPEARNHRAYIRALVGRELEAALADVEVALAGSGAGAPEFLDTRGFILHLLGRHQEAIDDLNQAIGKTQQDRREVAGLAGRVDPVELACRLRPIDHGLAVMHHHRGLACRAIGLERQAAQDLETAERKGFDPTRGVL